MIRYKAYLLLVSVNFVISCGSSQTTSSPSAYVTQQQAQEAFKIVKSLDYIPFGYKIDGCYARSLFMSMELASYKIPSSAQFVLGDLKPSTEVQWRYHVTPMLIVGTDTEPTVVDPSLMPGPAKLSQWVKAMNAGANTELVAVPGSYYDPYATPMKSDEKIIHSFAELPAFNQSDISRACKTLHSYLNNENAENREEKQAKLNQHAQDLGARLYRLGKLKLSSSMEEPGGVNTSIECEGSPFN